MCSCETCKKNAKLITHIQIATNTLILLARVIMVQIKQIVYKYKDYSLHESKCLHKCTISCSSLRAKSHREIRFANE